MGMRVDDHLSGGTADDRTSWEHLLYWRLTGQHHCAVKGYFGNTQRIEDKAGLPRNVYLFLGRCEPHYGEHAVAFECLDKGEFLVSPFDTGGIISGHTHTVQPATDEQRAELVRKWSFIPKAYRKELADWGRLAYDSSAEYTGGEPPRFHLVDEIDLRTAVDDHDSYAWDWEIRLEARPANCAHLVPQILIMTRAQRDAYATWLGAADILSVKKYAKHMRDVERIRIDPGGNLQSDFINTMLQCEQLW